MEHKFWKIEDFYIGNCSTCIFAFFSNFHWFRQRNLKSKCLTSEPLDSFAPPSPGQASPAQSSLSFSLFQSTHIPNPALYPEAICFSSHWRLWRARPVATVTATAQSDRERERERDGELKLQSAWCRCLLPVVCFVSFAKTINDAPWRLFGGTLWALLSTNWKGK